MLRETPSSQENRFSGLGGHLAFQLVQANDLVKEPPLQDGENTQKEDSFILSHGKKMGTIIVLFLPRIRPSPFALPSAGPTDGAVMSFVWSNHHLRLSSERCHFPFFLSLSFRC